MNPCAYLLLNRKSRERFLSVTSDTAQSSGLEENWNATKELLYRNLRIYVNKYAIIYLERNM